MQTKKKIKSFYFIFRMWARRPLTHICESLKYLAFPFHINYCTAVEPQLRAGIFTVTINSGHMTVKTATTDQTKGCAKNKLGSSMRVCVHACVWVLPARRRSCGDGHTAACGWRKHSAGVSTQAPNSQKATGKLYHGRCVKFVSAKVLLKSGALEKILLRKAIGSKSLQ